MYPENSLFQSFQSISFRVHISRSFFHVVWLRDFHRKLCESEITEKQITTKSSQGFQLKTASSFQLPLLFMVRWHQWACDNCDRPETWLWLTKMHWTRLSIWATNRHLLKVKIEKRNLSSVEFISLIFHSDNFQFYSNFSTSETQQLEIFKQDLQCLIPSKLFSLWISKEF